MRWLRRGATVAVFAFLLSVVVAGCGGGDGDTDGPTGLDPLDLVGSYELLSLQFQQQPVLRPPAAVGTLILTSTNYEVDISINLPLDTMMIHDRGAYQVQSNGTWSQTSSEMDLQSVGTVELSNDTLTVDVTTQGQRVLNVWRRSN